MTILAPYLARSYQATHRLSKESRDAVIADLKSAMVANPALADVAQSEFDRLDDLRSHIEATGNQLSSRCAVSATYLSFLRDALAH